jgi:hypothetical protein
MQRRIRSERFTIAMTVVCAVLLLTDVLRLTGAL